MSKNDKEIAARIAHSSIWSGMAPKEDHACAAWKRTNGIAALEEPEDGAGESTSRL
jgi:hypothetical protein